MLTYILRTAVLGSAMLALSGCGGGSGGGSLTVTDPGALPTGTNVAPITVDSGPAGTVNSPFVSVTLCAPGTSNCQTIDHLLVDTGSTGVRVIASVLIPSLTLPAAHDSAGNVTAECGQFADGSTFGPIKLADVKIAGEQASNLPIQVIGDPQLPNIPADCLATGPSENTVQSFGANGVIGVGIFIEDCGTACAAAAVRATYYSCPISGCANAAMPLTGQIQNPVARFVANNNGIAVVMRSVDSAGAALASGALVFGIGTQSNNSLSGKSVLTLDPNFGTLTTIFNGQSLRNSFVDTGSNGLFFNDNSLPLCTGNLAPGFYCPVSVQSRTAMLQSVTGVAVDANFNVANAIALLGNNTTFIAFGNLAGSNPLTSSFDWGMPFFFGRTVFFAIEGRNTPSGLGPFLAY